MVEHFGTPLNADRHTQGVNRCRVGGPLGLIDAFNANLCKRLRRRTTSLSSVVVDTVSSRREGAHAAAAVLRHPTVLRHSPVVSHDDDHQAFLFVQIPDHDCGKRGVRGLVDQVATSSQVLDGKAEFSAGQCAAGSDGCRGPGQSQEDVGERRLHLERLEDMGVGPEDLETFPDDFTVGMRGRADIIGAVDESAPANWILSRAVHVRKVYPRNELPEPGETQAERRRILRRPTGR
jgi:hypothetical protein